MASKLPLEIWLMIANEIGASDDLRSAWFWLRPVCRSAKEATELAVRHKILPRLRMDVLNDDKFTKNYGGTGQPRDFTQAHFELPFQGLSADGSRAIFRPTQGSKIIFAELAFWDVFYHLWPGVLWHEETVLFDWARTTQLKVLRDQWKKRGSSSEEEIKLTGLASQHFQTYVTGSCAAAIPDHSDIDMDSQTLEVSTPWRHLVTLYMREGEMIGEGLRRAAMADEERRLRMLRAPNRAEQALILAFSSETCRRLRFLKGLEDAADRRSTIRGIRYGKRALQYHMELILELDGDDPFKDDWMLFYYDDNRPQIEVPPEVAAGWFDEWKFHLLAGLPQT